MAVRARDRLLKAANDLFYAEGFRAVGVERLLSESGVGRASFYRHFTGKDELVAAMLNSYDVEYRDWLRTRVEELGGHPLAVFDAAAQRAEETDFRGCAFLNALAEVADPKDPVRDLVVRHKAAVADYIADLLRAADMTPAAALAKQWVMLLDGAVVTGSYERNTSAFARAKHLASSS